MGMGNGTGMSIGTGMGAGMGSGMGNGMNAEIENEKTLSRVNQIKGEDCVEEIARMISGDKITDEAREASRVLISGSPNS